MHPRLRRLLPAALSSVLFAAAATIALPAHAELGDWEGDYVPAKPKRRSDFVAGLTGGAFLGVSSGYPNDVRKIDDSAYRASTDFAVGNGGLLWFGGTLRDWFSFGIGTGGGGMTGSGVDASLFWFGVHVEAFPFFYQGSFGENFGLTTDLGIGGSTIQKGKDVLADGGATSFVSAGAFWEPINLWHHVSMGPSLAYAHQFALPISTHWVLIAWRTTFYGGPG